MAEKHPVHVWVGKSSMAGEYAADLGDKRRLRRAQHVGVALSQTPERSFPKTFQEESELEAFYRLVENEAVGWRTLAEAHASSSVSRVSGRPEVLIVHDTTDVTFHTYWPEQLRSQLTKITSQTHGFYLHTSLSVTARGPVLPLGVVGLQPFVHKVGIGTGDTRTQDFWLQEGGLFDNEHERWFRAIDETNQRFAGSGTRAIHVMDRETDSYGLMSWMVAEQVSFVVRCDTSRRLNVCDALREAGEVEVMLGERFPLRKGHSGDSHPPRRSRAALLTLRAGVVTLRRTSKREDASWSPGGWSTQPKTLNLHLVEAVEKQPPAGEKGVRWLLLTQEPIGTPEQVLRVVEFYRSRWMVEEYFKALKTGCRLEERQMGSAAALLRVLALLVPAAWRLLLLRTLSEAEPDASWQSLLTPLEYRVLQRAVPKASLSRKGTAAQCLAAIAKLGGHLPRNGRPGWQTLHAGWRRLEDYVAGARLMI